MDGDGWQLVLAIALAVNGVLGFVYRIYRLSKGGPMSDVIGQAILGVLLGTLALGAALDAGFARWPAIVYGLLFALVVMPIWVLAVLIPQRPGAIDYAFTGTYWIVLILIVVAGFAT